MPNTLGVIYDSQTFKWDSEAGKFLGSLSTHPAVLRTLFRDSMDLGFGIRSRKTGSVAFFILQDIIYDGEQILKWVFHPSDSCKSKNQLLENVTAEILKV